jgi:hypothetical protein
MLVHLDSPNGKIARPAFYLSCFPPTNGRGEIVAAARWVIVNPVAASLGSLASRPFGVAPWRSTGNRVHWAIACFTRCRCCLAFLGVRGLGVTYSGLSTTSGVGGFC